MSHSDWFISPMPNPNATLRVFCFPYAGGSAATYMSWAKSLPVNVELVAVQLPGRANRLFEPPHSNMDSLITELVDVISGLLDKPYILFGHSLGSRVAFELLDKCNRLQLPIPKHFVASGSRGPHSTARDEPIYHLPDDELILKLNELNGTPKEILENAELMSLCLPLLRADFELSDTYCYTSDTKFDCPISVLGGDDDTDITHDDLLSWGRYFSHTVETHILAGDHFFIDSNKQPVLKIINSIVSDTLESLSEIKEKQHLADVV